MFKNSEVSSHMHLLKEEDEETRRKVGQANGGKHSSSITRYNIDLLKGAHGQTCQKPWPIWHRRFMGKGHQISRVQISKSDTYWFASGL